MRMRTPPPSTAISIGGCTGRGVSRGCVSRGCVSVCVCVVVVVVLVVVVCVCVCVCVQRGVHPPAQLHARILTPSQFYAGIHPPKQND